MSEFDQYELKGDRLLDEQLNALLKGHMDPPNGAIAHAVKRANEAAQAAIKAGEEMRRLDIQRNQVVERGLKLNGARDSYHDDIREQLLEIVQKKEENTPCPKS